MSNDFNNLKEEALERWVQWTKKNSPKEQSLRRIALGYEDKFFKDLTLQQKRIRKALLSYPNNDEGGRIQSAENDLDHDLSIGRYWVFKYRTYPVETDFGECSIGKFEIYIKRGLEDPRAKQVLLHEMIHAYEDQLRKIYSQFCDWLVIDLYKRVSKEIGQAEVDRLLTKGANAETAERYHSGMFLLKSLELDLRNKWELETVFMYEQ